MYIQHIIPLTFSSTKGAEGSAHHPLPFISTLLILFQQSNQPYAVVHMFSFACKNTQQNSN